MSTLKSRLAVSYRLARVAERKLLHEARRPEHRLRLLVCHANMLDALILSISETEREQDRRFEEFFFGSRTTEKSEAMVQNSSQLHTSEEKDNSREKDQDDCFTNSDIATIAAKIREPEIPSKRTVRSRSKVPAKSDPMPPTVAKDTLHVIGYQLEKITLRHDGKVADSAIQYQMEEGYQTFTQTAIDYMVSSMKAAELV